MKAGNESAWADDPFSFGADPLSAGVAGENKEEGSVNTNFLFYVNPLDFISILIRKCRRFFQLGL